MVEIQKRKTVGLAIASLVLGLFILVPLLGMLCGLIAIVFGIIALVQISKNKGALKGKGLAIAGIVLGVIGIIVVPIVFLTAALTYTARAVANKRCEANESQAVAELRVISAAAESYAAAAAGKYPETESDLINSNPAHLNRYYDGKTIAGYTYKVQMGATGYEITAEPAECGVTGQKTFTIKTNGELNEENCR